MFLIVEELIIGVPSIILRDGERVDLVADSYREISWKNSTRAAKVKIQDTNPFLHENENKWQLIKLFFNWFIDSRRKILNTLNTTSLYMSTEGYCQRLTISDVSSIDSLMSTHEEALMVHAKHAIISNSPVIIRSHYGDIHLNHGIDIVLFRQSGPH